jgi:hypothetical protein
MSPKTRLRYKKVWKAGVFDDQKTAAQIVSSETVSVTQEDFQSYVLSQIKRIIHGNAVGRWFDDPTVVPSNIKVLIDLVYGSRYNVELLGVKNDVNRTFTTPDKFLHQSYYGAEPRIRMMHNGRRLIEADDFTVSESGGVGTGFDTVTVVSFSPSSRSRLTADYVKKP